MRIWLRSAGCVVAVVACTVGMLGCETSSHKSVRTYEYSDDGRAPAQAPEQELDSDYQMQSPGQMVSPGTMVVDPDGS